MARVIGGPSEARSSGGRSASGVPSRRRSGRRPWRMRLPWRRRRLRLRDVRALAAGWPSGSGTSPDTRGHGAWLRVESAVSSRRIGLPRHPTARPSGFAGRDIWTRSRRMCGGAEEPPAPPVKISPAGTEVGPAQSIGRVGSIPIDAARPGTEWKGVVHHGEATAPQDRTRRPDARGVG